jgi:tetratricopeptide (TPR) repeat protein
MHENDLTFFDQEALLYRLHDGLENSEKDVVFVVGAPLTAPVDNERGVANVDGVVELIRSEFSSKKSHIEKLESELRTSKNSYQSAFEFLVGRAGQDAANRIVKRAVSRSLLPSNGVEWFDSIDKLADDQLQSFDTQPDAWHFSPAVNALGALITKYPDRFGKALITSNFDPLVELAILNNGGSAWRTALSVDGSLTQSKANGCQVVHIHGFWHGSDTLHTGRQLIQTRPTLQNDLLMLLQNKIVVVIAYGGWPDIFTGALSGVVSNDNLFPEVLWTFYDEHPNLNEHLRASLQPGLNRNRVTLYAGIDCHEFLPELLNLWDGTPSQPCPKINQTNSHAVTKNTKSSHAKLFKLAPLECDRPPATEVWVGRESELRALETSHAKVVIVCGLGGQGKSVLASHYIGSLGEMEGKYRLWDWRDCKEQSDRIRTQIIEIIVRFSNAGISAEDLLEADDDELIEVLIDHTHDANAILVFDNVDSYVDLENRTFIGTLDKLVKQISISNTSSRLIMTCRPDVQYTSTSTITFSLQGISEDEAIELFSKRAPSAKIPEEDIREACALTKGHPFWLDLIAVQVTKVPGNTLRKLLDDMRRGREDIPDVLSSIWDKLALRERTLLRFMAEAVRPETEKTIEKFVASQINFKNFTRAMRSLINFNLIVVKPEVDAPDLYDLHPLVRQFVRAKFALSERQGIIAVVINQYKMIIGAIENMLGINLPFGMLERWSQKAELEVSAELYEEAFETLSKVEDALIGGGHVQEYVRVGRLLFESIDWETAANKYKKFDNVVGTMIAAFDQLEDFESADSLIKRYEKTIPQKTARYIKYCDIVTYSYWNRGNYDAAIEWGTRGVNLKQETNVDTDFDCEHNLALARRDSGNPEVAMEYFLKGYEIASLLQGNEALSGNGPLYGNVGRCLQFLNRLDEALVCFKKSMNILEKDSSLHSKSNRAYARRWVGQIFAALGQPTMAQAFFVDAIRILGASAPGRVRQLCTDIGELHGTAKILSESDATRSVQNWMRS